MIQNAGTYLNLPFLLASSHITSEQEYGEPLHYCQDKTAIHIPYSISVHTQGRVETTWCPDVIGRVPVGSQKSCPYPGALANTSKTFISHLSLK